MALLGVFTAVLSAALIFSSSQAFHLVPEKGAAAVTSGRSTMTCLQAQRDWPLSRRAALFSATTASLFSWLGVASLLPPPAGAVLGGSTQSARVAAWPGIESLEPLFELKLSVDALSAGVKDPKAWPLIEKRLKRFFKGMIISEKNFYMGVALQYMNDIKYDKDELSEYIRMDKDARFNAIDLTMKSLELLKTSLGKFDAGAIEENAATAKTSLDSWFGLVPESDLRAVEQLFRDVKGADANRDGVLTDEELKALPESEREIWKRRVDKFG